ncbi:nuclear transport factor 2 family protein [Chitinophaga sp. sic0106]|uniref:nuclear transport factor 2 family protein n=1 Tax=Chitinophaga sp. sic0106 TaxID=2854785 RepID=UPI001C472D23|nr:nuclear transport factor 2 family protein [Chitinophaga sp. sic0106]MBV7529871.1 nuclear transport factor 2 family protein [Chitinophaga sp. sic0106]
MKSGFFIISLIIMGLTSVAQTTKDSLAIKWAALDYIEAQHNPNPTQMEMALHPQLVKRTFWKDASTQRDYIRETSAEYMILLAEGYNKKNDKFPANPKKEVIFLDISDRTASVKLVADEWIDYMHLVKLNGSWKIINVLWQYNDSSRHK